MLLWQFKKMHIFLVLIQQSTYFRQIKNRHGQTLAILNNGEVRGVPEEAPANKSAVLEFIPTEPPGAYRIRGIQANLYLAMNAKGKALKSSYFLKGVPNGSQ